MQRYRRHLEMYKESLIIEHGTLAATVPWHMAHGTAASRTLHAATYGIMEVYVLQYCMQSTST